jgi:hypothetical protein
MAGAINDCRHADIEGSSLTHSNGRRFRQLRIPADFRRRMHRRRADVNDVKGTTDNSSTSRETPLANWPSWISALKAARTLRMLSRAEISGLLIKIIEFPDVSVSPVPQYPGYPAPLATLFWLEEFERRTQKGGIGRGSMVLRIKIDLVFDLLYK